MRFGVLGTGRVGRALASRLVELGHEVAMGSRSADNPAAKEWAASVGGGGRSGTFAEAAAFGEVVVNATAGAASLQALQMAGARNLAGKVLIDVANPIDPASGLPPTLSVCNTDSLGEQIQRTFPDAMVVKALNTVNADVMVNPGLVPGSHNVFLSGNDERAKARVAEILVDFGWDPADIVDLGDITTARGTEMYLALWLRLWAVKGTGHFNIRVVSPQPG